MSADTHWRVDAIEDGVARVHPPQGRPISLPLGWLPSGAQENDLLAIDLNQRRDASVIRIERDIQATEEALRRSRAQVDRLGRTSARRDPGGDSTL